jgi:hypothetical protein
MGISPQLIDFFKGSVHTQIHNSVKLIMPARSAIDCVIPYLSRSIAARTPEPASHRIDTREPKNRDLRAMRCLLAQALHCQ